MKKTEIMIAYCLERLGKLYRFGSHGPDYWNCNRMEGQHGN